MDEQEELPFSEDPAENYSIENEILKLKLQAQYGDSFSIETGNEQLPPHIENQFLKQMIAIEEKFNNAEFIIIKDKIGNPQLPDVAELNPLQLKDALDYITNTLEQHNLYLNILDGPYPDEVIYTFITKELLLKEIEKELPEGMHCNFIYEEFYPNHQADLTKIGNEFINAWYLREEAGITYYLAQDMIHEAERKVTKEQVLQKIKNIWDAFYAFELLEYKIYEVEHTLYNNIDNDALAGMGHIEGIISYNAVLDNGDVVPYKQPFKLYCGLVYSQWQIFNFIMPGYT